MVWIRSDSTLAYHAKLESLIEKIDCTRREAVGSLHLLWWWTAENGRDGILPRITDSQIAGICDHRGDAGRFVLALIISGFIDKTDSGLAIHDWKEWISDPVRIKELRKSTRNVQEKPVQKPVQMNGSEQSLSLKDVVLVFPTAGDLKTYDVTTQELQKLTELYPGVNVLMEAKKALHWVETTPSKKKTAKGMPRFLASWMERCQNRGFRGNASIPEPYDREKQRKITEQINETIRKYKQGGTPRGS